jgi:hypothetical protein
MKGTTDLYRNEIPSCELRRLFKDAVAIMKGFGYRYLWIDALCIIQGDDSDWLDQSAKMAGIYENARYTVAAHGA